MAKKVAGDWANFLVLDVVRYFILFGFWFMIQDYQLVIKLVSHNRTFLHSSHVYRLYFLCPPHLSNILASRHGSNHNPTPITGGGTRKILSQKYANAGSVEMQEEMWLSSISLRSDLQTNSNEELRSESVVSFRSRKIQVCEICTLLVDDLEGLCFPALGRNVFFCQHIPARMQRPTSPRT